MSTYCLEVFMCRVVCWEGADEGVKMWQGVRGGGQNVAGGEGGHHVAGGAGGSECFTSHLVRVCGLGVHHVRVQK